MLPDGTLSLVSRLLPAWVQEVVTPIGTVPIGGVIPIGAACTLIGTVPIGVITP